MRCNGRRRGEDPPPSEVAGDAPTRATPNETGHRNVSQNIAVNLSQRRSAADVIRMKSLRVFLSDERGGEVLEYALIAGLIVVAAITVIGAVGNKVLARWQSLNSSM
jgi:Flp pilus assembly pilin Flp